MKFCLDWRANRQNVIYAWGNAAALGSDDGDPGDNDFNDLVLSTVCVDGDFVAATDSVVVLK